MSLESKLDKKIMDQIRCLKNVDTSGIMVSFKGNGIVILAGEASSYVDKYIIEKTIQENIQVKGIVQELKVNIATPYAKNDIYILEDALAALKANQNISNAGIKIIVENNAITLSGYVHKASQKKCAEEAVQSIVGIIGVINNIVIK